MKRVSRSAIVAQSALTMYDLVERIEDYPEFLPWCQSTKVHERIAGVTRASLSVGLKGIKQSFTTENHNRPGESIEMRLVRGPFRRFSASWRFFNLGENASKIEFQMEHEFSSRVLSKLLEPLFDQIADTMVDAFIRRADATSGHDTG